MTALRRADWRFLLPAPSGERYRHLALLGGSDELLARIGSLALEATRGLPGIETADLVVLMADRELALEAVLPRIGPDAVVYLEVDRRRSGGRLLTPGRLGRTLPRHGLTPIAWHWAIPDFDRARRHIPLDNAAALRWYLSTLQTGASPLGRAADAGIRLLARAGSGALAAVVPCYAVTAVGKARRPSPVGALAPIAAPVAMITSGQDDGSRVVLLPFEGGSPRPTRVVKVARLAAFEGHTEREQETLTELRRRLPPADRELVPEPLGMWRWQGLLVAGESYAPGTPIVVTSGRYGAPFEEVRADLRHAVDWLIRFHVGVAAGPGCWSPAMAERAADRLERCRELLGAGSPAHALLSGAARAALKLSGLALPLVPLHNDLGPWNLHRENARVTAIDWELAAGGVAERTGPGPCDLFYFSTYWYCRVRHLSGERAEQRGLRELFARPSEGQAVRAVQEELARYASALEVRHSFLPLLLVLTWAERALDWADRASVGRPAAGPSANRYTGYLEVLAERAGPWMQEGRWP